MYPNALDVAFSFINHHKVLLVEIHKLASLLPSSATLSATATTRSWDSIIITSTRLSHQKLDEVKLLHEILYELLNEQLFELFEEVLGENLLILVH